MTLAPFRATADWTVATIAPSNLWDGTVSWGGRTVPTESGIAYGSGWTQKTIGNFDTPPYQWITADTHVGVVCDHGDSSWIDYVEFWCEGTTTRVTRNGYNPDTGAIGFVVKVQPPAGTDGDVDIYAKIVPVNGYERLVGPLRMIFNKGGSITRTVKTVKTSGGDYATIREASNAAADGWIVKVDAGTWTEDTTGVAYGGSALSRGFEIRPADGLSASDVIIRRSSRAEFRSFTRPKTTYRNLKFETSNITVFYDGDVKTFIGCTFYDANGSNFSPGYPSSGALAPTTFFRGDEGQITHLVDCTFRQPICTGWKFARNTLFDYSYDAWTIRNETNQLTDHVCIGCTANQNGTFYMRLHSASSLTASSASYNAGTGRTTITWSGSPSITDVSAPAGSDYKLFITSGALSGQSFAIYSQTDSSDQTVVTGDASSMGVASAWSGVAAHCDTMQTFGTAGTFTYGNIIAQRYKTTGQTYQPIFLQTSSATGTHSGIACQLCLFVFTGGGDDESQLQNPCTNIVLRQCTHIGTDIEFRNDSTGWAASGIVFDGCLFEDVLVATGGVLPSGITLRNCHFTSGSTWSSSGSSTGDPSINADYRPTAGSAVLAGCTTKFPFDYYLNRWTGTVAKGACKEVS